MDLLKELDRISQLEAKADFQTAFSFLKDLEKRNGLPDEVYLRIQIQKLSLLKNMGEFTQFLTFAPFVVQLAKDLGTSLQVVDMLNESALACWLTEKYDESLDHLKEAEAILVTIPKDRDSEKEKRMAWILHHKGRNYNYAFDDYEKALEFALEAEVLFKKRHDKFEQALTGDLIAEIYAADGKADLALERYSQNLQIFQEIKNAWGIAHTAWKIGEILLYRGDIDAALEYLEKSKTLSEKIGHRETLAHSYSTLGRLYVQKGDLNQALEYYQCSIGIYQEHGRRYFIALSLDRLGDISFIKGELSDALEYYQESLKNLESFHRMQRFNVAQIYNKIGKIYHARGEYQQAFDLYDRCLDHIKETELMFLPFRGLGYLPHYNLIKLCIDLNRLEQAKDYLQQLGRIIEKDQNKWLHQIYNLGHATFLRAQSRAIPRGEAQKLFKQVAEEDIIDFELTVDAILNLIELLIEEFHHYRNDEIIAEVSDWLNSLVRLAQEKNSFFLLAESYLLQSRLSLIDLNVSESQRLLEKALDIAEKKDLRRLADIIIMEQQILAEQFLARQLEGFPKEKFPMSETVETTYFLSMVDRMIHKRLYFSESEIMALFKQGKVSIETCLGSFSDRGWIIQKTTASCPLNVEQLRSILEYTGVLYQRGELETFYGPFPQPLIYGTTRVDWHYITYGVKVRDESIKDTRISSKGGRVLAIFLFIYPKQLDSMMLLSKRIISEYLAFLLTENQGISDITIGHLEQVEKKISESLFSEFSRT